MNFLYGSSEQIVENTSINRIIRQSNVGLLRKLLIGFLF